MRDRAGATVTTAVTTLDVHDLARSARTYGLAGLWVVTPVAAQREVIATILRHWGDEGAGARRTPERGEALALVHAVPTLDEAIAGVAQAHRAPPRLVVTSARGGPTPVSPYEAERRASEARPTLIAFGTGHGLADVVLARADARLPPIREGTYNHLSVRAAFAITLDRLFGRGGERVESASASASESASNPDMGADTDAE